MTTTTTTTSDDVCIWVVVNQRLDRCHCSDECLHCTDRHEGLCSPVSGCHGNCRESYVCDLPTFQTLTSSTSMFFHCICSPVWAHLIHQMCLSALAVGRLWSANSQWPGPCMPFDAVEDFTCVSECAFCAFELDGTHFLGKIIPHVLNFEGFNFLKSFTESLKSLKEIPR